MPSGVQKASGEGNVPTPLQCVLGPKVKYGHMRAIIII